MSDKEAKYLNEQKEIVKSGGSITRDEYKTNKSKSPIKTT